MEALERIKPIGVAKSYSLKLCFNYERLVNNGHTQIRSKMTT